MTNKGMKAGTNTKADAKKYLKYPDGTPYTGAPYLYGWIFFGSVFKLHFDDSDGPNPFRIIERENGEIHLADHSATNEHHVLCQYDCPGKVQILGHSAERSSAYCHYFMFFGRTNIRTNIQHFS